MEERYTDIRLVKVPIEIDNKNQLDFSSATTQYNYFNSCNYIELDDSSYQRKDNTVRYPGHIDDLIGYNYCMYKNSSYSNKWFYAFITDMQYINDSMTLVSIKTDTWQTWQFDIDIKKCFVEREHVNDDTVGLHTIPEGLELGDYVSTGSRPIEVYGDELSDYYIVLGVTQFPGTEVYIGDKTGGGLYGGVYSTIKYIVGEDYEGMVNIVKSYNDTGKIDSIQCCFMAPKYICGTINWVTAQSEPGWSYIIKYGIIQNSSYVGVSLLTSERPSKLAGNYTPVNNKLLTWPYMYLSVDNNVGNCNILKYEDMTLINNKISFDIIGALTPGCSFKITPHGYKGVESNYMYSIVPTKLPICNWENDIYTNWLTQNGVNTALQVVGSGLSTAVGVATGNAIAVTSGILGIANSLGQVYEHSLIPPTVEGNLNTGDVTFAAGLSSPISYDMSIKPEYAKIIDDFFSMFGYKVNSVKIPNVSGRTNWNYVKTIDCNIHGYIPQKDCIEIKNMFNNGVTFWHNPSTFLDYSQSNTIVSGS